MRLEQSKDGGEMVGKWWGNGVVQNHLQGGFKEAQCGAEKNWPETPKASPVSDWKSSQLLLKTFPESSSHLNGWVTLACCGSDVVSSMTSKVDLFQKFVDPQKYGCFRK